MTVVGDIADALDGRTIAGAFHAAGDFEACCRVVDRCTGKKFVSTTQPGAESPLGSVAFNAVFGDSLEDKRGRSSGVRGLSRGPRSPRAATSPRLSP